MKISRRRLIQAAGLSLCPFSLSPFSISMGQASVSGLQKQVPSSGELIPAIGLGTWITFNVGDNSDLRDSRCDVLNRFFDLGGRMVDSSPMYGSAEEVLGYCESRSPAPDQYMRTTKVWTSSSNAGRTQIQDSYRLWGTKSFGLFQVHNLVNWQSHLPYLQELKAENKIRYVGVSTSHGHRHKELAEIMKTQDIDFVQLTYNIRDRQAEDYLLPLARERGIGIVVNRPFRRGGLFEYLQGVPLPEFAKEIDCQNMAQLMLKFVISHPDVTCAIPATSQLVHLEENMAAQSGVMPDQAMRHQMTKWFDSL